MAANKFATMLHRNTNKITVILVYAFLEWILIFSILLNALFFYLIIKYAEYFGLKKPCILCCRLDHIIEPKKDKKYCRDLVCDAHAKEIYKLGFFSNHQKLSEPQDMCEDSSFSSQQLECSELSRDYAFFPWMKKTGLIQGAGEVAAENCVLNSLCSCCGASSEREFYSPCVLHKPSWEVLEYSQKGNLIKEAEEDDTIGGGDPFDFDLSILEFVSNQLQNEQPIEENVDVIIEETEMKAEENCSCSVCDADCKKMAANEDENFRSDIEKEQERNKEEELNVMMNDTSCYQSENQVSCGKEASPETGTKHLEFYIDGDDCHLIPVEFIDPVTAENKSGYKFKEDGQGDSGNEDVILDFIMHDFGTQVEFVLENKASSGDAAGLASVNENEDELKDPELEDVEVNESEWSSFIQAEVGEMKEEEEHEQAATEQMTQILSTGRKLDDQVSAETTTEDMEGDANQVCDDVLQMQSDEMDAEISIGTEIPDHEPIDDLQTQEDLSSSPSKEEVVFASSSELQTYEDHHGFSKSENDVEFRTIAIETRKEAINNHLYSTSKVNENEEEKVPDMPTSIDSLHQLHKKLLLLDRRESGIEESLDGGSVISDIDAIDASDGVLTVEKLKSALRADRKALNVLYAELEEERSASAIAANQTMAMINRLQEEKAAMQMEALQYQRMMEEQSEYDQEALQLLNELMVKREREKAEIEKELEIYRKRVHEYEGKEKIQMLRRRSRASSASCSNAEDSDGVSVDLNHESKEDESFDNNQGSSNQYTPADAELYLEESLASFEDERISILEQLKVLEEKLFTLNDEEEQHFENIKSMDHFYQENRNGYNENHDFNNEANGVASNGHFKEMNGKLHQQERKVIGAKARTLLPLFNAIGKETEDGNLNGNHELDYDSVSLQNSFIAKFELDNKRIAIEEEVDHVYGRLQALEADRQFLKHCISSLRKGDKGLYLLQEILQHLRELRNVEIRTRTMADAAS